MENTQVQATLAIGLASFIILSKLCSANVASALGFLVISLQTCLLYVSGCLLVCVNRRFVSLCCVVSLFSINIVYAIHHLKQQLEHNKF